MKTSRVLLGLAGLEIRGGIASVMRCVVRACDEAVRAGRLTRADRVLLFDDPARPPAPPVRGEQWLARGSQARFVWQLWRALRRQRPELVFFDQLGPARSVRAPLPGLPPERYAIFCHGEELRRAGGAARGRVLRGAWRLLANSEYTAGLVRQYAPEAAERVRVVPLCIDPAKVEAWEREPAAEAASAPPAALIIGRLWAEERGKGHDALLEAWPAVRRAHPEAELWIVGDGDDRPRLEEKARSLGVAPAVRFFGDVSDAELAGLYRRATLFAMPSRQEGFGLVYAEAMWHGLPCIGSRADAAGQVIADGETGLLVPYDAPEPLGAALGSLFGDPARCRALGEAGRRRARERFTYPRFRQALASALELPL